MEEPQVRVDSLGRAYAGSQLQIQLYINRLQNEFNMAILDALPSLAASKPTFRWTSPLEADTFAEYQDLAFLKAVEHENLVQRLRDFWPKGGPVWDGLAVVEFGNGPGERGILLIEAKSHVPEVYSGGCQASERSRKKVVAALERTKRWLGVPQGVDWTGPLYQFANRLAHVYFFREVAGIPAWFVNVLFLNDPHSPTSMDDWRKALPQIKEELGLANIALPNVGYVFLQAKQRSQLGGT